MRCPNCNNTLVMADRQGIEIDYCPECRGVWLDRGELDKIIERSHQVYTPAPRQEMPRQEVPRVEQPRGDYPAIPYKEGYGRGDDYRRDREYRDDDDYDHDHKKRKRRSFLDDIFDFD
jgi:uncharacterized protein